MRFTYHNIIVIILKDIHTDVKFDLTIIFSTLKSRKLNVSFNTNQLRKTNTFVILSDKLLISQDKGSTQQSQ